MKSTWIQRATVMGLVLGLSLPVFAQYDDAFQGPNRRGQGMEQMINQLNLSAEQQQQMKQIMALDQDLFTQVRQMRQDMRQAQKNGDQQQAAQIQQQLASMQPQIQAAKQARKGAMEQVLNPEQLRQLEALKGQRSQRRPTS